MYQIKEITLHHGKQTRKRLIIEFNNQENAILGEFLMTDAPMFHGELLNEVKAVLKDEREIVNGSGNRTSWNIDKQKAVIDDLFAEMEENFTSYPSTIIETTKLYDIMTVWFQARKDFQETDNK